MTPDRYEREFHLPAGHATSFAGGPLAALRNRNPELTRYETAGERAVPHRAATFPGAGVWGASGRNAATVRAAVCGAHETRGRQHGAPPGAGSERVRPAAPDVPSGVKGHPRWVEPGIPVPYSTGASARSGLFGANLAEDDRRVCRGGRRGRLHGRRSSSTSSPTRSRPAGSASAPSRSSSGRSAASPGSNVEAPHRRAEGWIAAAGPITSLGIGGRRPRCRVRRSQPRSRGRRRRRCSSGSGSSTSRSRSSTCCPARRSTAVGSCKAVRWGRHGDRYRATREAGHAGKASAGRSSASAVSCSCAGTTWHLADRHRPFIASTPRSRSWRATSPSGSTASRSAISRGSASPHAGATSTPTRCCGSARASARPASWRSTGGGDRPRPRSSCSRTQLLGRARRRAAVGDADAADGAVRSTSHGPHPDDELSSVLPRLNPRRAGRDGVATRASCSASCRRSGSR